MIPITESDLKSIVDLVKTVPEEYRQLCFKLLLERTLQLPVDVPPVPPAPPTGPAAQSPQRNLRLPIDVRAFLTQYGIDESVLWKCFHVEGAEIRPIYEITTTKKARAEIEYALLMALQSAITTGQFTVGIEDLRVRCVDAKCYDRPNFFRILKNNEKLFKTVSADQPLVLSLDGKAELAELLDTMKA